MNVLANLSAGAVLLISTTVQDFAFRVVYRLVTGQWPGES
jgi:hypothetical protein